MPMATRSVTAVLLIISSFCFVAGWKRTCTCPSTVVQPTNKENSISSDVPIVKNVLDQLSLCPWKMEMDFDRYRMPASLIYAKLQTSAYCNSMERQCMAVTETVNVTVRCSSSRCVTCTEDIPVAFVCAMRHVVAIE